MLFTIFTELVYFFIYFIFMCLLIKLKKKKKLNFPENMLKYHKNYNRRWSSIAVNKSNCLFIK